jgi:S-adenosylmethionine:tRNA ribosyltransferase-isomerase
VTHNIELYDYHLPEELIAQTPEKNRHNSRLLRLDRAAAKISHHRFFDLPDLLLPSDLLVVNNTKVFPARINAKRKSGGKVEIVFIREDEEGLWTALVRGISKLEIGEELIAGDYTIIYHGRENSGAIAGGAAKLSVAGDRSVYEMCEQIGEPPLPPYIKTENGFARKYIDRYQTLFADKTGSCAAPTAGLHFSDEVKKRLLDKGIGTAKITLHVGPGTFRPIKVENINEHKMDGERYEITQKSAELINSAVDEGRRIVAVGSTSLRTIESCAGDDGKVIAGAGESSLYITPGYRFKVASAMITNFHLPKSSLMVLVSAFAGREKIVKAYAEAIKLRYRFFSFGDGMLIE